MHVDMLYVPLHARVTSSSRYSCLMAVHTSTVCFILTPSSMHACMWTCYCTTFLRARVTSSSRYSSLMRGKDEHSHIWCSLVLVPLPCALALYSYILYAHINSNLLTKWRNGRF